MRNQYILLAGLTLILGSFYTQIVLNHMASTHLGKKKRAGNRFVSMFEGGLENNRKRLGEESDWGRNSTVHFFHLNNQTFIDRLQMCILDPECQVMYHHIQKASGTYIGTSLFQWMNTQFPNVMQDLWKQHQQFIYEQQQLQELNAYMLEDNYMSFEPMPLKILDKFKPMKLDGREWCCFGSFMNRFIWNPDDYCGYKFSSWEVNAKQMVDIVDTCQSQQNFHFLAQGQTRFHKPMKDVVHNRKSHRFTKAAIIVTYREPVGRATSLVHQLCNEISFSRVRLQIQSGNWDSLNLDKTPRGMQELFDACRRCNYNGQSNNSSLTYANDAEIWDLLVMDTNNILKGVGYLARAFQKRNEYELEQNNLGDPSLAEVFVLDTRGVSSFFNELQARFRNRPIPQGEVNSNKPFRVCQFNTTTFPDMMAGLREGQQIYDDLTLGII